MKRIKTAEDVKKAMELNSAFYGYVMRLNEDDIESFEDAHREDCESVLAECKRMMAEAMDESQSLQRLSLYIKGINAKIDKTLDDKWTPSVDETIEHYLLNNGKDEPFWNIIIDGEKVFRLEECYSPSADKTFIMREEFWVDDEESEMPNQECVGWYCGEPTPDATRHFYMVLR